MRILHSKALLCLGSFLLAACPGDDTSGEDGPSADSGASGTASTTEPSMTSATEPGMTSMTEPGNTDTMADSDTGPATQPCGEAECSDAEWCNFSDDACGEGRFAMATCEPYPEGCDDSYMPVCGCDGQVHSNVCYANMLGVDLAAEGDCEAPEGYFPCGYRFCSLGFEYCQVQTSDIGGFGHSYSCMPPAMECPGGITCDCLGDELCFEFGCMETPDGGTEIGCPGG